MENEIDWGDSFVDDYGNEILFRGYLENGYFITQMLIVADEGPWKTIIMKKVEL